MSRFLNLLRARNEVKKAQLMSRAEVLRLQEQRWRAMARYALEVSPFYRRHLAGIDVERCQLTDIPPLTKELLVANWDEIVPDVRLRRTALERFLSEPANWGRLYHGRWMVSMTSGTTGAALAIPHDLAAVDWGHASQNLRNSASPHSSRQPQLPFFRRRLRAAAFVTSTAPSISGALYATRPWVGALFCKYHRINVTAPWAEILAEVQRIRPDVMMGYASLFGRLAQAQLSGELKLSLPPERGCIWAGGDAVTPGIRDLCQRAFGIQPFSMYGCGETLSIARQWRGMRHLVCHDDVMVFEAVDATGQPVPEGVLSDHALATPLLNKALPLLRYRINDRVEMGPVDSEWPFQTIRQIHGRSTMTYVFRAPERQVFVGTRFLFVMEHRADVAAYQFRQTAPDAVECLVIPQPGADVEALLRELPAAMLHSLQEGGCPGVQAAARVVPQLWPDPRTGKVEQNVPLRDETA
jgi:phenylacetate-CoA ligase